jgi:AcrR family transcriptional regulator
MRRTQEERSEGTRSVIIGAADRLFAARGFADTSIEDVLKGAGVTRGALYHHFESKAAIFLAVFDKREAALSAAIVARAARGRTSWGRFKAGCHGFLEACLDPAVQRIILIDAWSVLGFDVIRGIEAKYTFALLKDGLAAAVREGEIDVGNVDVMANFLLGALSQSAMAIARAKNSRTELAAAQRELDRLLAGLSR